MPKTGKKQVCAICGHSKPDNLFRDGFNSGLLVHVDCQSSDKGQAWKQARIRNEPGYERWCRLMGGETRCPNCGLLALYCRKGGGHSPAWEVHCDRCSEATVGFDPYRGSSDLWYKLVELSEQFIKEEWSEEKVLAEVQELADKFDSGLFAIDCKCGGRFSLAACPRCRRCSQFLQLSPFVTAFEPPERLLKKTRER